MNKIAAGEVIERPASVVKEILENSIDAGASHVELVVEGGGIELIRISDNGYGIPSDQLELAVAPHATSKLHSSDDLFDVKTLGFRGEALASIAEISHLILRSRTSDSDSGYELSVKGGEKEPIRPRSGPVGTTIEIRHLFFNTPVRRTETPAAVRCTASPSPAISNTGPARRRSPYATLRSPPTCSGMKALPIPRSNSPAPEPSYLWP